MSGTMFQQSIPKKSQCAFVSTRSQKGESPQSQSTNDTEVDAVLVDTPLTLNDNPSIAYPKAMLLQVRMTIQRDAEMRALNVRPIIELPESFQTPDWKQRNPAKPMVDPKVAADDESVLNNVRAILGKLSMETFGTLFENLMTCGVDTPERVLILMAEVFDTAQKQQPLVPMYADLCEKLANDSRISSILGIAKDSFPQLLLRQCQNSIANLLAPRNDEQPLEKMPLEEENLYRKQQALGNMKLIGHLLVKKMIASQMLVDWAGELLAKRDSCPEALESLAAFLMVAGPEFDIPTWEHHTRLQEIFTAIRKTAKSKSTPSRARFILKDVLEAREAGWLNSKESRSSLNANCNHGGAAAEKLDVSLFDVVAFRRILASVLGDLVSSQDVAAAVHRIRLQQVPIGCQGQQTADMLTRILEERRGPHRRRAIAFAVGLVASEQRAFDRNAFLDGLGTFFQDVYPELCLEVPRLQSMAATELVPVLLTVYSKDEVSGVLPIGMYCPALRA